MNGIYIYQSTIEVDEDEVNMIEEIVVEAAEEEEEIIIIIIIIKAIIITTKIKAK
jgi:hypothetical protein